MLAKTKGKWKQGKIKTAYLIALAVFFLGMYIWRPSFGQNNAGDRMRITASSSLQAASAATHQEFHPFGLFSDPRYSPMERISLIVVLVIAVLGLLYAVMLVGQVKNADQGTPRMQEIAAAVREGANAYLASQFKRIAILIVVITLGLYFTYTGNVTAFGIGRAAAFLVGSLFSFCVGFGGI